MQAVYVQAHTHIHTHTQAHIHYTRAHTGVAQPGHEQGPKALRISGAVDCILAHDSLLLHSCGGSAGQ